MPDYYTTGFDCYPPFYTCIHSTDLLNIHLLCTNTDAMKYTQKKFQRSLLPKKLKFCYPLNRKAHIRSYNPRQKGTGP